MNNLRTSLWWNTVVPQVMGWLYFCLLFYKTPAGLISKSTLSFIGALIITASFGYLLNDFFDVTQDRATGKQNFFSGINRYASVVILVSVLCMSVFLWMQIETGLLSDVLFLTQLISLAVYSAPPFRLKEKGIAGVLCDAFYGHINPVLITFSVFMPSVSLDQVHIFLVVFLSIALALKGVRNIVLHQIEDRKKDRTSGTQTFVIQNGGLFALYFVNYLLRIEFIAVLGLSVVLCVLFPPVIISVFLFSIIWYLAFSGWKLAYLPPRQLKFKFLYFLNDYYENWLPAIFLLILVFKQSYLWPLLILHHSLFPGFIVKLRTNFKIIQQNFKSEEDY